MQVTTLTQDVLSLKAEKTAQPQQNVASYAVPCQPSRPPVNNAPIMSSTVSSGLGENVSPDASTSRTSAPTGSVTESSMYPPHSVVSQICCCGQHVSSYGASVVPPRGQSLSPTQRSHTFSPGPSDCIMPPASTSQTISPSLRGQLVPPSSSAPVSQPSGFPWILYQPPGELLQSLSRSPSALSTDETDNVEPLPSPEEPEDMSGEQVTSSSVERSPCRGRTRGRKRGRARGRGIGRDNPNHSSSQYQAQKNVSTRSQSASTFPGRCLDKRCSDISNVSEHHIQNLRSHSNEKISTPSNSSVVNIPALPSNGSGDMNVVQFPGQSSPCIPPSQLSGKLETTPTTQEHTSNVQEGSDSDDSAFKSKLGKTAEELALEAKILPDKNMKCSLCNLVVRNMSTLTYHIRLKHTKEKPYKCKVWI